MALRASSSDLHPTSGGRFVFERSSGFEARYQVNVYLPNEVTISGTLQLMTERSSELELDTEDPWVRDQVEKLCRVLRRTRQQRIVRWRPRD
ncbi:MAG: hypothetical protein ACPHRO_02745 [Nannocystaceae bacterium]